MPVIIIVNSIVIIFINCIFHRCRCKEVLVKLSFRWQCKAILHRLLAGNLIFRKTSRVQVATFKTKSTTVEWTLKVSSGALPRYKMLQYSINHSDLDLNI